MRLILITLDITQCHVIILFSKQLLFTLILVLLILGKTRLWSITKYLWYIELSVCRSKVVYIYTIIKRYIKVQIPDAHYTFFPMRCVQVTHTNIYGNLSIRVVFTRIQAIASIGKWNRRTIYLLMSCSRAYSTYRKLKRKNKVSCFIFQRLDTVMPYGDYYY